MGLLTDKRVIDNNVRQWHRSCESAKGEG